jgi:hypothetical protein
MQKMLVRIFFKINVVQKAYRTPIILVFAKFCGISAQCYLHRSPMPQKVFGMYMF